MNLFTNLIFIKNIEDKGGKLCGISKREKLLVYLLKTHSIQLPTRAIFDETFVPKKKNRAHCEIILKSNTALCNATIQNENS